MTASVPCPLAEGANLRISQTQNTMPTGRNA